MTGKLGASQSHPRPRVNKRATRVDVRRAAKLIDAHGAEYDVTLLDVSSGGFRLETSEGLRIGEFVTLLVERGLRFDAQIRWALGNDAGGVFLARVDTSEWT